MDRPVKAESDQEESNINGLHPSQYTAQGPKPDRPNVGESNVENSHSSSPSTPPTLEDLNTYIRTRAPHIALSTRTLFETRYSHLSPLEKHHLRQSMNGGDVANYAGMIYAMEGPEALQHLAMLAKDKTPTNFEVVRQQRGWYGGIFK